MLGFRIQSFHWVTWGSKIVGRFITYYYPICYMKGYIKEDILQRLEKLRNENLGEMSLVTTSEMYEHLDYFICTSLYLAKHPTSEIEFKHQEVSEYLKSLFNIELPGETLKEFLNHYIEEFQGGPISKTETCYKWDGAFWKVKKLVPPLGYKPKHTFLPGFE